MARPFFVGTRGTQVHDRVHCGRPLCWVGPMNVPSFHHVVLFRLREGVTLERVRCAREALAELVETMPGVLHLTVGDNLADQNGGFTLVLFAAFENRPAFEVCTRHPEWRRVFREFIEPVVAEQIVAESEAR